MKNLRYILFLSFIATFSSSCKKEFDNPPARTIAEGTVMTIADVRAMYVPGQTTQINEDISVYGVVTADETTGNLYKESYIQDETGALYLRFLSSTGLYIGDSIRVNLNGAIILKYNQMLQIDSLHADNNIQKISTQNYRTPEVVTIADLNANIEGYQGKLIQVNDVRFAEGGQGLSYADGTNQNDSSRYLVDLSSAQAEVRTSGYANFANDTLPNGSGSFIGISQQYNSDLQLLIRNPNELTMNGPLPQIITKDFNDNIVTSGGWVVKEPIPATTSTLTWDTDMQGSANTPYGVITNWNGSSNEPLESWLISPVMDFSLSTSPSLSLLSDYKFTGTTLEVLVSTDYDGVSMPGTATWTPLSVPLDTDGSDWGFEPSGPVSLSSYIGNNSVYIGFKYVGSNSDGSTWELDDIQITY